MNDSLSRMRIGELAERAGVSQRTLHYYESLGLIAPSEREGRGYRYYDAHALRRLERIDQLKGLGLSLEEIGEVLPSYFEDPDGDPAGVRGKRRVLAVLERHLAEADRRLGELQALRGDLAANIDRLTRYIREAGGE